MLLLLLLLGLGRGRRVLLGEADGLELEVERRAGVGLLAARGGGGAVVRVVRVQRPEGGGRVGEPVPLVVLRPEGRDTLV